MHPRLLSHGPHEIAQRITPSASYSIEASSVQNAAPLPTAQRKNAEQRTQAICPCGRAPRQNAAHRRLHPPSGAAAFQGVIGESKEGLGGNRNPPGPPWPPEAATRLLPQPKAAQERATQPAGQRKNAEHHTPPYPCGSALHPKKPRRRKPKAPCGAPPQSTNSISPGAMRLTRASECRL